MKHLTWAKLKLMILSVTNPSPEHIWVLLVCKKEEWLKWISWIGPSDSLLRHILCSHLSLKAPQKLVFAMFLFILKIKTVNLENNSQNSMLVWNLEKNMTFVYVNFFSTVVDVFLQVVRGNWCTFYQQASERISHSSPSEALGKHKPFSLPSFLRFHEGLIYA